MLTELLTTKHVVASQQAPPPWRKIITLSERSVRLTPMPVAAPLPHCMPSTGIQVHVSFGAVMASPPSVAASIVDDEPPPHAASARTSHPPRMRPRLAQFTAPSQGASSHSMWLT